MKNQSFLYVAKPAGYDEWKVFSNTSGKKKQNLKYDVVFRPLSREEILYKGKSIVAALGYAERANSGARIDLSKKVVRRRRKNKNQIDAFDGQQW